LEIFAEGTDGNVYHNWQVTPGGGWSGWAGLGGGPITQPPSVVENSDGTLQVFIVNNGVVYTSQEQTPDDSSSWSGWIALGGASVAAPPSTILDYSGNLYIFAQGAMGLLYTILGLRLVAHGAVGPPWEAG
jgi:hypothetical protein